MIQGKDYTAFRIEANQLTAKQLAALRAQGRAGDLRAQILLGMAYQLGCPGSTHDLAEALKWYELAADQGSSIAANQIAVYYDPESWFGHQRGHDANEALNWYRKAAEHGDDVVTQFNVGEMLHQMGRDDEALEWYRKAAENGAPEAAIGLVALYDQGKVLHGKSKHENWKQAVEYFQPLADRGNPGAQYVMAEAYREGWLGVHRDPARAFELYRKAAAQGWPRAILAVGDSYYKGIGVSKDKTEAVKWLQRAADLADPIGAAFMAHIYENGDGAPKDMVAAYTWYMIAEFLDRRVSFRHHLSTAELNEAEKRVQAFKIAHGLMDY